MEGAVGWVLVVEDDPGYREALCAAVQAFGYPVRMARHGRHAWGQLAELPAAELPGLILLDLLMPVMDGWELRGRLLEHTHLSLIPVVVTTPVPLEYREENAVYAAAYLSRPLDLAALREVLQRYCRPAPSPLDGPPV